MTVNDQDLSFGRLRTGSEHGTRDAAGSTTRPASPAVPLPEPAGA